MSQRSHGFAAGLVALLLVAVPTLAATRTPRLASDETCKQLKDALTRNVGVKPTMRSGSARVRDVLGEGGSAAPDAAAELVLSAMAGMMADKSADPRALDVMRRAGAKRAGGSAAGFAELGCTP
jgi:hypothetical protein